MTPLAEKREANVVRVREELRKLVRISDMSQRAIERHNDWHPRYLHQVLCGNLQLTMRHVYGILLALRIPVDRFFEHVADQDG
jgi:hypothetical protein